MPESMFWWLRSPGGYQDRAAYVFSSGNLNTFGSSVDYGNGVRPALWVEINNK